MIKILFKMLNDEKNDRIDDIKPFDRIKKNLENIFHFNFMINYNQLYHLFRD